MDPIEEFKQERSKAIEKMSQDEDIKKKSLDWMLHADKYKYTYNYTWLVSRQACNVARNITYVFHNQYGMIEYEEIYRDTGQR